MHLSEVHELPAARVIKSGNTASNINLKRRKNNSTQIESDQFLWAEHE